MHGKDGQGKAGILWSLLSISAQARRGSAWQGKAWHVRAGTGSAGRGKARRGLRNHFFTAWLGGPRRGEAWPGGVRHGVARFLISMKEVRASENETTEN